MIYMRNITITTAKSATYLENVGLLLSGAAFSVMIAMRFEIATDLQKAEASGSENHTWTISQIEADMVRYIYALDEASHHASPDNMAEVFQKFDTLSSRVDTLRVILSSRIPDLAREKGWIDLAGPAGLIRRHQIIIDPFYQDFQDKDRVDDRNFTETLLEMKREARAVSEGVRTVVVSAYLGTTSQVTELRTDLDKTLDLFSASLVVAMTLSCLLMITLHYQGRERLELLQKTEKESRSFKATLDSSLDAVFVVDQRGKIIWGNAASKTVFGLDMAEKPAGYLDRLLNLGEHKGIVRDIIQTSRRKRFRMTGTRSDGTVFPVDVSGSLWSDGSDEEVMVFFIRDISEQVSFEETLAAARNDAQKGDEAKARFLAVMSHEMRTPLNGLLAAADLMTRKVELSGDAARFTRIIQSCALDTLDHINNVLELTRLEDQHGAHYTRSSLPLISVLRAIIVQFEAEAEQRGLQINFKPEGNYDNLKIEAAPSLLRRVIVNFLSNAVKFTDFGHIDIVIRVRPGTEEGSRKIRISVCDTGIGIAEENIQKIFETFETLDASYARVREGSGLGLGIAKLAAEAMGGHIEVESRPERGSNFTLAFEASLSLTEEVTDQVATDYQERHLRLLVAEDNKFSRELLVEMLSFEGHSVEAAEDGVEAVAKANLKVFDAILMDLSMPHLDGLAATRLIKQQSLNTTTPIIGLTAQADMEMLQRYMNTGLVKVILKPASLEQITDCLFGIYADQDEIDADGTELVQMQSFTKKMKMVGRDRIRALSLGCLNESLEAIFSIDGLNEEDFLRRSVIISHREAGGAASLGFLELQREWLGIETAARSGHVDRVRSGTVRIREIVSSTRTLLEDVFREESLETA